MDTNKKDYLKNLGKSFYYSGKRAMSDLMPNSQKLITDTVEAKAKVFDGAKSVKNDYIGETEKFIKSTFKKTIDNALMELKTGKIYDPEKVAKADLQMLGASFSEIGDAADDLMNLLNEDDDFESGSSSSEEVIEDSSKDSLDDSSNDENEAITVFNRDVKKTVLKRVTNNVKIGNSKAQHVTNQILLSHMKTVTKAIEQSTSAITSSLHSINEFNDQVSREFYNDTSEKLATIVNSLNTISKSYLEAESNKYQSELRKLQDSINSGGNIYEILKGLYDYNKDTAMQDMMGMMIPQLKGVISSAAENPLGTLMTTGMKALLPKDIKESLNKIDTMVGGLPVNMAYMFNNWKDSNESINVFGKDIKWKQILGNKFGIDLSPKKEIHLEKYERGNMSWNGIAQRTLVNVIPSLLSKILSSVSDNESYRDELIYDYDKGQFTNKSSVKRETSRKFKDTVFDSMGSQVDNIINYMNEHQTKSVKEEDIQEIKDVIYKMAMVGKSINNYELGKLSKNKDVERAMRRYFKEGSNTTEFNDSLFNATRSLEDVYEEFSNSKNIAGQMSIDYKQNLYELSSKQKQEKLLEEQQERIKELNKEKSKDFFDNLLNRSLGLEDAEPNVVSEKLEKIAERVNREFNSYSIKRDNNKNKDKGQKSFLDPSSLLERNEFLKNLVTKVTTDFYDNNALDAGDARPINRDINIENMSDAKILERQKRVYEKYKKYRNKSTEDAINNSKRRNLTREELADVRGLKVSSRDKNNFNSDGLITLNENLNNLLGGISHDGTFGKVQEKILNKISSTMSESSSKQDSLISIMESVSKNNSKKSFNVTLTGGHIDKVEKISKPLETVKDETKPKKEKDLTESYKNVTAKIKEEEEENKNASDAILDGAEERKAIQDKRIEDYKERTKDITVDKYGNVTDNPNKPEGLMDKAGNKVNSLIDNSNAGKYVNAKLSRISNKIQSKLKIPGAEKITGGQKSTDELKALGYTPVWIMGSNVSLGGKKKRKGKNRDTEDIVEDVENLLPEKYRGKLSSVLGKGNKLAGKVVGKALKGSAKLTGKVLTKGSGLLGKAAIGAGSLAIKGSTKGIPLVGKALGGVAKGLGKASELTDKASKVEKLGDRVSGNEKLTDFKNNITDKLKSDETQEKINQMKIKSAEKRELLMDKFTTKRETIKDALENKFTAVKQALEKKGLLKREGLISAIQMKGLALREGLKLKGEKLLLGIQKAWGLAKEGVKGGIEVAGTAIKSLAKAVQGIPFLGKGLAIAGTIGGIALLGGLIGKAIKSFSKGGEKPGEASAGGLGSGISALFKGGKGKKEKSSSSSNLATSGSGSASSSGSSGSFGTGSTGSSAFSNNPDSAEANKTTAEGYVEDAESKMNGEGLEGYGDFSNKLTNIGLSQGSSSELATSGSGTATTTSNLSVGKVKAKGMTPVWIMGSNTSLDGSDDARAKHDKEMEKEETKQHNKKLLGYQKEQSESTRGLVRGFTSLFREGLPQNDSIINVNVDVDATNETKITQTDQTNIINDGKKSTVNNNKNTQVESKYHTNVNPNGIKNELIKSTNGNEVQKATNNDVQSESHTDANIIVDTNKLDENDKPVFDSTYAITEEEFNKEEANRELGKYLAPGAGKSNYSSTSGYKNNAGAGTNSGGVNPSGGNNNGGSTNGNVSYNPGYGSGNGNNSSGVGTNSGGSTNGTPNYGSNNGGGSNGGNNSSGGNSSNGSATPIINIPNYEKYYQDIINKIKNIENYSSNIPKTNEILNKIYTLIDKMNEKQSNISNITNSSNDFSFPELDNDIRLIASGI